MPCPKCGAENDARAIECSFCGVVLAKATRSGVRVPRIREPRVDELERIGGGRIGPSELKVMGFGLAAAIVVYFVPLTRMMFSALVTLFHELGHAVVGWLFGYPSIPAFDFVYGGGITHMGNFQKPIAYLVALG